MSQSAQTLEPGAGRSAAIKTTSRGRRLWRGVRRLPVFSLVVLVIVVLTGAVAPWIQPHDPNEPNLVNALQHPVFFGGTWEHPLGTDELGRDTLSRLIAGARVSLLVGAAVVIGAGAIGTAMALLAGYFGGIVDIVISRIVDVFLAVPFLLVAIAVVGAIGASERNLVLTLVFMLWAQYARVLRGEVLRLKEAEFVRLAKIAGASHFRILSRHIFINLINPLVILATLQLGGVMIIEASLSFLGLGVPPPQATWGGMLSGGKDFMGINDELTIIPGATIALTVLSINLLGDWLRLRLDPRFRQL